MVGDDDALDVAVADGAEADGAAALAPPRGGEYACFVLETRNSGSEGVIWTVRTYFRSSEVGCCDEDVARGGDCGDATFDGCNGCGEAIFFV